MLETFIFQQLYAQYLYSIQIHKQIIKSVAALVNTISSYLEGRMEILGVHENLEPIIKHPFRF